jgi:hypothetical protein
VHLPQIHILTCTQDIYDNIELTVIEEKIYAYILLIHTIAISATTVDQKVLKEILGN